MPSKTLSEKAKADRDARLAAARDAKASIADRNNGKTIGQNHFPCDGSGVIDLPPVRQNKNPKLYY